MTAVAAEAEGRSLPESASVEEIKAGAGPASVYTFDEGFQEKIVALCLRDPMFMARAEGLIKPEYFESTSHAALVNIANRYFETYRKIPGDKTTLSHLIRRDVINKVITKEIAAGCVRGLLDRKKEEVEAGLSPGLFQVDVSDRDYVVDQVATFARNRAVSQAILESVEDVDRNDFDRINTRMRQALDVGAHTDSGMYDYGEAIEARTHTRLDRAAGKLPPTGITTGNYEFDKLLYHRGWGRRELSVLLGAAKMGKTTALLDFGISACGSAQKHNVLYVTLEVSADIIAERLDARVSETKMSDLDKNIHSIKSAVQVFMKNAGKFIIQEYPSGMMRVSDLRRLIERYKSKGIIFDMVVVDYADLMQPERITDSTTENSKSIYVNLRGLAMQEGFAILTATQTNREGAKKAVATATDVAEDFNKIRIADVVISLNKTDEERKMNECRLHFAACRNQAGGFTVRIRQEIEKMRFFAEYLGED